MTKIHSQITEEDEIHFPKGFVEATTDTERVAVKETNGNYLWKPSNEITGTEGPPGPPIATLSVANIRDPVELNALDDSVESQYITTQTGATPTDRNRSSYYVYQSGATMPEYPPLLVDGLNGKWVLLNGESITLSAMESASTSTLFGGHITINAGDASTFDIDDTLVEIIDNYTDGANPTQTFIFVPSATGVTVDNLATFDDSFVFVGASGLTQATTVSDASFFRTNAFLATLFHSNNVVIGAVSNVPSFSISPSLALDDLTLAVGPINFSGNIFGPDAANLQFDKTAGSTMEKNVNAVNDLQNPNFSQDVALTGGEEFFHEYRDGSGGFTFETDALVDPLRFDDGTGTLALVPATEWSLRRMYWHPSLADNTRTGFAGVVYGTETYATEDEALDAVSTSNWDLSDSLNFASHRATLVVIQSATDLSDAAQATFISHGKFGGGSVSAGSPAVTTLQEAYDNSSGAPIITTAPGNPFTVRRGGAASTTVLDLRDNGDASIFNVNASGAITGTNATTILQGLMSAADKTKSDAITDVGSGIIISAAERTKLDTIPQGWMQFSNAAPFSSASVTATPITLDTDQDSFANSLFTKLNATQIQTDFDGFVEISYRGNGAGNANETTSTLLVEKNDVLVPISEQVITCSRVLFEVGFANTFVISCAVDDTFELNYLSLAGSLYDFAIDDLHMSVKAIRIS